LNTIFICYPSINAELDEYENALESEKKLTSVLEKDNEGLQKQIEDCNKKKCIKKLQYEAFFFKRHQKQKKIYLEKRRESLKLSSRLIPKKRNTLSDFTF
jgi:hypothetical protein